MIKKIFALLLALCLGLSLAACNNTQNPSGEPAADNTGVFEKPENYSAVLLASINPQIKMYLAENGIVLVIEAVNEDAEQIVDEILTENADYLTVIKAFVSAANSKGFIKDGAKIEFEVVEQKDNKLDAQDILKKASVAAENAAVELNISLEVPDKEADNSDQPVPDTQTTPPPSDNTEQPEAHTHTYSKATCTEAAKCSCGATSGNALGHSWQSATCKAPKTCKTCGATEGGNGEHTYINGTCSVCGATSALNPKTNLSTDEYVGNLNVSGDMLIGAALQFDGEACVVIERYFNSVQTDPDQIPIVFEGKNYYSEGGGLNPHYYELTDTEILVKGGFWEDASDAVTIKLILQSNGMLKVTHSTNAQLPVDTILSTNISDVLR